MVKEANKAIENPKERLNDKYFSKVCFTFDSYLCEWKGSDLNSLEDRTIFIEEFSMIPNK